jgi:hypothetical protein
MSTSALTRSVFVFVAFTLTSAAIAADNDGTSPQRQHCEDIAAADYQFNVRSCEANLQGDNEALGQCLTDSAHDYFAALNKCKAIPRLKQSLPDLRRNGVLVQN